MPRRRKTPPLPGTDGRGGRRTGAPGRAYPNRSDLTAQPVRTTTGQAYGQAAQQQAAQRAVPMAGPAQAPQPQGGLPPGVPPPGSFAVDAPTERPDEPVTAGVPRGLGPGPEALNLPPASAHNEDVSMRIRALYRQFPYPELADLIDDLDLM